MAEINNLSTGKGKIMKKKPPSFVLFKRIAVLILSLAIIPIYAQKTIKVAVRAHSGEEAAVKKWTATTDYLTQSIDGYTFQLVPVVKFEDMRIIVKNKEVDFVLTNPVAFIDLMTKYGVSRIATLVNGREENGYAEFGGVVFTRSDRNDITVLSDIKRKSILGVDSEAFGGWRMIYRQLLEMDIDPFEDCSAVRFSATSTQPDIVFDVINGKADVGSVRTGILEDLVERGEIDFSEIKIIEPVFDDFPLVHTTILYPEWPFSALKNTNEKLIRQVTLALLLIEKENPAAKIGGYSGWGIPLSYTPVIDLLKALKIAPYEHLGELTILEVFKQYKLWVFAGFFIFILLIILILISLRLNNKLNVKKANLEEKVKERTSELQTELVERKKAEAKIKESQQRFETLFNFGADAVFVHPYTESGFKNFIEVNRIACKMFGYSREEFLNLKASNISSKPDVDQKGTEEHRTKLKKAKHMVFEAKMIKKSGEEFPVEISSTVFDYQGQKVIMSVVRDITERKDAEKKLITEQEFSKKIIETSAAIIVGLDKNHHIQLFNTGAEKITGYKKEEVIGKDWFKLFFPGDLQSEMNMVWKNAWGVLSHTYENLILIKTGEERIISWQNTGFYEGKDSSKHLLISIGEDITERKKTEIELEKHRNHLEELVNERTLELEEKNNDLSRVNKLFVGRELRMRELKEEIEKLRKGH